MNRFNRIDCESPPRLELCSILGGLFGGGKKKSQKQPKQFVESRMTARTGKPRRKPRKKGPMAKTDPFQRREHRQTNLDPYNRRGE